MCLCRWWMDLQIPQYRNLKLISQVIASLEIIFPHIVASLSFPLCNENLNSFLTRWGNYSRRGKYSREETIWGNTVTTFIFLKKKSGFIDSGFVAAFDELVTTIEFAFIYRDVHFRALCLLFQSLFPLNWNFGGYFPKALLYCLDKESKSTQLF